MRHAHVTGVASTHVGEIPGSTCMSLHAEAAFAALADAGVEGRDVDGLLCAYSLVEPQIMLAAAFVEFSGLRPKSR